MPFLHHYLASLPSGLASYPECKGKASLVRAVLAERPIRLDDRVTLPTSAPLPRADERLPRELQDLVATPPPSSAWIPEAHYVGVSLAIADAYGLDEDGFRGFWRSTMRRLTTGVYGTLLGFLKPGTVLRQAGERWNVFHVGTSCAVSGSGADLEITLTYPSRLFPNVIVEGYRGVFQGLVDRSNRPEAEVLVVRARATEPDRHAATYAIRGWLGR